MQKEMDDKIEKSGFCLTSIVQPVYRPTPMIFLTPSLSDMHYIYKDAD